MFMHNNEITQTAIKILTKDPYICEVAAYPLHDKRFTKVGCIWAWCQLLKKHDPDFAIDGDAIDWVQVERAIRDAEELRRL